MLITFHAVYNGPVPPKVCLIIVVCIICTVHLHHPKFILHTASFFAVPHLKKFATSLFLSLQWGSKVLPSSTWFVFFLKFINSLFIGDHINPSKSVYIILGLLLDMSSFFRRVKTNDQICSLFTIPLSWCCQVSVIIIWLPHWCRQLAFSPNQGFALKHLVFLSAASLFLSLQWGSKVLPPALGFQGFASSTWFVFVLKFISSLLTGDHISPSGAVFQSHLDCCWMCRHFSDE